MTATESQLRRRAQRQGLRLEKSRARNPRATTFGTYWLIDPFTNTVAAGDTNNGYGMTLEQIEQSLAE